MDKCLLCACDNHFYEENLAIDSNTAEAVMSALLNLNEKFTPPEPPVYSNNPMTEQVEAVTVANEEPDCLRWRCWIC